MDDTLNELDTKFSDVHYDAAKSEMYDYLKTDPSSPFEGRTLAEIFIFSMAIAKKIGMAPEKPQKPSKMPPYAFGAEMRAFMRSILIEENNDVYSIKSNADLRRMCEGYANAGIGTLYTKIKNRPVGTEGEDVLAEFLQS